MQEAKQDRNRERLPEGHSSCGPSTEHQPSRSSNLFGELEKQAQGLRTLPAARGMSRGGGGGCIRAVGTREEKAEKKVWNEL